MSLDLDLSHLTKGFVFKGSKTKVLDDTGFVRLVDYMGGDESIVQAARVSYGEGTKTAREDKKLIAYLMRNRHTSPFEHVVLKFHVKAPIFVFRQWHRHRTWSFNEVSARYSEMTDEFYVPPVERMTMQDVKNRQGSSDTLIEQPETAVDIIRRNSEACYLQYQALLALGVARETAREVLPVNLYSEMYATVDLHNLFHFLGLRVDAHAQWEIRQYAEAMLAYAEKVAPWAVEAWRETR